MKLNYKKTILTGFAFMAITSFWTMYDAITPLILKYSFNLGDVQALGAAHLHGLDQPGP